MARPAKSEHRESGDEHAQHRFDNRLGDAAKQEQAERDAEQRGEHQPGGASQVHVPPVLRDDDGSHGDRDQHGDRRRHLDRQHERQQRDGDERFAEPERGSDERRAKEHHHDEEGQRVHTHRPPRVLTDERG